MFFTNATQNFNSNLNSAMCSFIKSAAFYRMAAVISLLWLAVIQAQAATLTVTKIADTNDGVCNADCSLREAIGFALPGDTIVFSSLFNDPRQITLTLGELLINKNLTIAGTGANILTVQRSTATGAPNFRIFNIAGSGNVVNISGLRIAFGNAVFGGGIILERGNTLNLDKATVNNNLILRREMNLI